MHPWDKRPVFIFPWLGMTAWERPTSIIPSPSRRSRAARPEEMDYLFEAIRSQFPGAAITPADVVSAMAGVRPVIASGKGLNPSQESREHSVWHHDGMVCVAGGKLTTFRLIALDALRAAGLIGEAEHKAAKRSPAPLFRHELAFPHRLGHPGFAAAQGRGAARNASLGARKRDGCAPGRSAAAPRARRQHQAAGARDLLPQIRALCQSRLGWDDARWAGEAARYLKIVARAYSPPGAAGTP